MTDLVSPADIERIVGAPRHQHRHIGRAVSSEKIVYVLHSQECKDSGVDLRECTFSLALDRGIRREIWERFQDMPVELAVLTNGELAPVCAWR